MYRLVKLSEKNLFLDLSIRFICRIQFCIISIWNELTGWLRNNGIGGKSYANLKRMKNIHMGERCFILCTGPSLTVNDLELLKNEYTFGMNSIVKTYERTDFRPTFYGIQDHLVYAKMQNEILKEYENSDNVIVSDRIKWHSSIGKSWMVFPLNMSYNAYDRWFNQKFCCKFSDNAYRRVYSGFSITHSLIEIAVYMGFKEIYLLGADCSFSNPEKLHFVEHGVEDKTIDTARERNIAGYLAAKEAADKSDFCIYNATRGGELEVFERRNLDDVLSGMYT